jgi:hypothetical protein
MNNSIAFAEVRKLLESAGYALLKIHADRRVFIKRGYPVISFPVKDKRVRETYYNRIKTILEIRNLI